MRLMNLEAVSEIVDAAEHIPSGASLVVHQLSWDDYELLLERLADRRSLRIDYDSGRLEIVSPSSRHGRYETLIPDLALIFCEAFQLKFEGFSPVTWKRRTLLKGVEPDASFYISTAERIIGKDIDLESDPPPDIVVEVDITSRSLRKFPIYAAFGIPEVWRYDGQTWRFYVLVEGTYTEAAASRCIPPLTAKIVTDAIEIGRVKGQDEARSAFRQMLKALKK
jgi:Uma2 family endonuclease